MILWIILRLAVSERQKYISRVKEAVYDQDKDKEFLDNFEQEMDDFDEDLTKTLDVYLEYLRNFVTMIQVTYSIVIRVSKTHICCQSENFLVKKKWINSKMILKSWRLMKKEVIV